MSLHRLVNASLLLLVPTACVGVPATGLLATKVRGPVAAATNAPPPESSRIGTAECYVAFGLLAHGDASIEAAMRLTLPSIMR
jgi:hypothetical protein